MKKMNYSSVLSIISVLVVSFTFSACGSDDNDNNDSVSNPLVGTWRAEIKEKGEVQFWDLTFNANYTCSYLEHNKFNDKVHDLRVGTYEIISGNILRTTMDSDYYHEKGKTATTRFVITDGNKLEFLDYDHGIIYYKIEN